MNMPNRDMPIREARVRYYEATTADGRKDALDTIIHNERRLARRYAPQYYAASEAWRDDGRHGMPPTLQDQEFADFYAAVDRGE